MILKRIYYVLFNTLEKYFIPVPSPCAIITSQLKPQKDITSRSAVIKESAPACTATEPLFCPVTKDTVSACTTCIRPLTLGWFLGGTSTLECDGDSSDLAAFYLAALFHHSDLFSIHLHRQPDYHPLCSIHNNNSLSGVIIMDHVSSRGHRG